MIWPIIKISPRAAGQVRGGSLWIFANEFVTKVKSLKVGEWVDFECDGKFIGFGYVNPHSLITGRICSLTPVTDRAAFLKQQIHKSVQARKSWGFLTSHRLIFSESDFLPGLIVDLYTDGKTQNVVAQFTTAGMDDAKSEIAEALKTATECSGLVLRGDSSIRSLEGLKNFVEIPFGVEAELRKTPILENDTWYEANLVSGQKTGFFLDQRENRKILRSFAQDKTVLDLCCYSGGWGIAALKGGATHVTFVDQSQDALDLVKKAMKLNDISENRAQFIAADVFEYLEKERNTFDIVVADPPAFVKSKKNLPQAKKAYAKLNSLSLRRLKPNGILFSSSCSYHLSEEEFEEILKESLQKSGQSGRVIYRGIQSLDHPWVLNRPESRYLKCLAVTI